MAKRSFAVDTSSLAAVRPTLDTGFYAGVLTNAGTTYGSDPVVDTLVIQAKTKWNKNKKVMEVVAGEFAIGGRFAFGAKLFSEKAKKVLQRDEPVVFGGQFYINFDDEFKIDANNNIPYRSLLTTLNLQDNDFNSEVDFDWVEDVTEDLVKAVVGFRGETEEERTDELSAIMGWTDLEAAYNSVVYHRKLFALIAESVNGQNVKVKVVKQDNYKNPSVKENAIDRGTTSAPFVGFLAYTDGFEFDLEDEE